MMRSSLTAYSRLIVILTILVASTIVHAAPTDISKTIRSAARKGASAEQIMDMLSGYGVSLSDAVVIAIHNAPDDLAGELAQVAVDRAPPNEKQNIAYLALGASSGLGTCLVAAAIDLPRPSACAEDNRYTYKDYRSYQPVPSSEIGGGGSYGPLASPGLM